MGCVLQPTRRGGLAPHGLCVSRGGGVKTGATLPWPLSGWSLQFVFFVLTLRSQSEGAGVKVAQHRAQRGLTLTQERPEIRLRRLPRTRNSSDQPQARGAAPALRPSPDASETRSGHGEPSTAPVSAAHSPVSKRPCDLQRSAATCEGRGGTVPPHGPPAHARVSSGTSVRRFSPGTRHACDCGPPAPRPAWPALLPALATVRAAAPGQHGVRCAHQQDGHASVSGAAPAPLGAWP